MIHGLAEINMDELKTALGVFGPVQIRVRNQNTVLAIYSSIETAEKALHDPMLPYKTAAYHTFTHMTSPKQERPIISSSGGRGQGGKRKISEELDNEPKKQKEEEEVKPSFPESCVMM